MKTSRLVLTAVALGLFGVACSSTKSTARGPDGSVDIASGISGGGGGLGTGGIGGEGTGAGGNGSGGLGGGGSDGTGPGTGGGLGNGGHGGTSDGGLGSGGRDGTGGGAGGGGSGGVSAKDASPRDVLPDVPVSSDGNPPGADVGLVCPDHMPSNPSTLGRCSLVPVTGNLHCVYNDADGGCGQSYYCGCALVPQGGGAVDCWWEHDPIPVCPDAGVAPADAASADVASGDVAGTQLCGGKVCAATEACCGPAECGTCIPAASGRYCPSTCSTSACGPSGAPCITGEICLDIKVTAGAKVASATSMCMPNPCTGQTLACACSANMCETINAQTTCAQAAPATGLLSCMGGGK